MQIRFARRVVTLLGPGWCVECDRREVAEVEEWSHPHVECGSGSTAEGGTGSGVIDLALGEH